MKPVTRHLFNMHTHGADATPQCVRSCGPADGNLCRLRHVLGGFARLGDANEINGHFVVYLQRPTGDDGNQHATTPTTYRLSGAQHIWRWTCQHSISAVAGVG